MLMAMLAMDMAMGNFFRRGGAHRHHRAAKLQGLTRQRMITV
jgi:hypothetical protein